jgi:broad specificity phosphatase PhoE
MPAPRNSLGQLGGLASGWLSWLRDLLDVIVRRFRCLLFGCGPTVVIALRHADIDLPPASADPPLNGAGLTRAAALVHHLGLSRVTAVFASTFERTQATARPLATQLGTAVQVRPATPTLDLATEILDSHRGETVVVVGHSNTVPQLAADLGAAFPTAPFAESDFDNLLWITVPETGHADVHHLRYGVPT